MFFKDTLRSCEGYLTVARREETTEHRAQTYQSLVLRGKLWTAIWWITERETGGVLQPGDKCTKTGYRVMEVLRTKHPKAWTHMAENLDHYKGRPLELTPVDITEETVTAVAGRLSGGAGPGGGGLSVIATLDPAVRRRKCGTEADCWGLRRVA